MGTDQTGAIGTAVRLLRHEIGLNRKELAERSGVSYPYLSEVEAGKKSPSSKTLAAIAEALGVKVHRLLEVAEGLGEADNSPGTWVVQRQSRYFHDDAMPAAAASMPPPAPAMASPKRGKIKGFARAPASEAPPPQSEASSSDPAQWQVDDLMTIARKLSPRDLELLLETARRLLR